MMKQFLLILPLILISYFCFGQNDINTRDSLLGQVNTITTAVPFLLISPDARAGAIGDAGVASSPDANSGHWNAAKFAFIEKKGGVSISYTPWLRTLVPDINLAYVSGYKKIDDLQAFAGSLRYFSLGDINFTDVTGNPIGNYKPSEFAVDIAYARKLAEFISGGLAIRYIHSNLTGGIDVLGASSKAGTSVAADLSSYFQKDVELGGKDAEMAFGVSISNIGAKVSYTETGTKDFIPINLRLGGRTTLDLNEFNQLAFLLDFNKLMVPTLPVYAKDETGTPIKDTLGNPILLAGKDPNVSVVTGMFQSFGDAPGGFKEEMREINISGGLEYWYDQQFAVRAGYFHEHETKGNRKFFTVGAGLRYNVFGLDFSYLIPTQQRNPLENTLRFSLVFNFDSLKSSPRESEE